MKSYKDWEMSEKLKTVSEQTSLNNWVVENLCEASTTSRYSVEVNFRTKIKETLEGYAKICLGYVSAALKQNGYHIKHVYDEAPIRILVSSRNWDDGEWVGLVAFNPEHDGGSFIICKGFYNRDAKTVSIQSKHKCKGDSAAEIAAELRDLMHELKNKKDRSVEKLKGINLKRGPK